jgi:hypothetical protein
MMNDPAPESGPLSTEDFWISLVFFLLVLGLFTAEICVNYHPVKLTALFILLFWIPLLVIHEAGHALVAVLLGWRVYRVVIGMGRPLLRFPIGRTPVEIRLFPLEGFVLPGPTNLRAPHLKSALIYLAGPGAVLLVLGLLVLILGPATLLTATDNMWLLAAQSLAVTVLLSAFCTLFPHYLKVRDQWVMSDGMGIIRSFLRSREDYARQLAEPESPWPVEREEERDEEDDWQR